MKRKLKIMLCIFLGLSLFGCSNTNGATQSNKTDNKAEKENIKKFNEEYEKRRFHFFELVATYYEDWGD